ncbi:MAG TPA: DUF4349 domain-containing protein [Gemmatimonadaceae bacterium]
MRSAPYLLCIATLIAGCGHDAARPAEKRMGDEMSRARAQIGAPALMAKAEGDAGNLKPADAPPAVALDATSAPVTSPRPGRSDSVISSMIIRTGQASVQVDSLERGIRAVRALSSRVGGFVANSSISSGDEQMHTATLEIKLPAAHFDDVINGLQPIGSLESVSVSAEDVGEEFVDVAARAENGHKLEQRLIDILGTRTGKLSDVLAVERELARVREEIERQEGRMRYLRTRAAMSTLSVTVHEKPPVVAGTGTLGVLADAFRQAWRNFIGFIASTIAAMGTLLPLAATVTAIVWLVWRARRARRMAATEAKA